MRRQFDANDRACVSCGPSVPLVTPLPSGSGVTGVNVPANPESLANAWSRSPAKW